MRTVTSKWTNKLVLALSNETPPPEIAVGLNYNILTKKMYWNYIVKNYGKGSAIRPAVCEYTSVLGGHFAVFGTGVRQIPTLVPGTVTFGTVFVPDPVTEERADLIRKTDNGMIVKLRFSYTDVFGTTYKDPICLNRFSNGSVGISDCTPEWISTMPTDTSNCGKTTK